MAELDEVARMIGEAEQATSAGDHQAAERALRRALMLQEAHYGLVHAEVASTLDHLGVVCGVLGRPDEAEYLHRRALGIAKRTVGADHPYAASSLRNLSNLYAAQGKPDKLASVVGGRSRKRALPDIDVDQENPLEVADADAPVQPPLLEPPEPAAAVLRDTASGAPPSLARMSGRAAALVFGGSVALLTTLWFLIGGSGGDGAERDPSPGVAAAAAAVPAVDSANGASDLPEVDLSTPVSAGPADQTQELPRALQISAIVAHAEVCSDLVTRDGAGARLPAWRCDRVVDGVSPGRLFFYTRIRSRTRTTIEHRWYRAGALDQVVALDIAANDGPGYRTYSTRSVTTQDGGEWRVEARSTDGERLLR